MIRASLLIAGLATILGAAALDVGSPIVVPAWVYLAGNLSVAASFVGRTSLRRAALAVGLMALSFGITMGGLSTLGHRLRGIRPGMTVEEVRRRLAGFREGTVPWSAVPLTGPIEHGVLYYRDPAAPADDYTYGVVHIQAGRVRQVEYLPD